MRWGRYAPGSTTLLLALALAGCGTRGGEVGVSESEIVLGTWGPQTGPAAAWGTVIRGMEVYFRLVNEEGGIHGRTVRFLARDDQYQPARTVSAVRELVERDGVLAIVGGIGTAPTMAVRDYLAEQGVPVLGLLSGAHQFVVPPTPTLFTGLPLYLEEGDLLAAYAADSLGRQRLAIVYQNDDYGRSGLEGARAALVARGRTAIAVSVELMDSDLSSQAIRLREAGADAVVLFTTPRHAAILLREAARIGYRPQWLGSSTLGDAALLHELSEGLWEGAIFASLLDLESDAPALQRFRQARERFAPGEREGYFFLAGMAVADMAAEALRRAGPDLTREGLIAAMEGMEGYQSIGAPVSFAGNPRAAWRAVLLKRCLPGGDVETLSGWIRSDADLEALAARVAH
jgi:branched-chain amino acid transport system substrate-binding protein